MQEHGLRPRARQEGLVVQELGDESLIYDRDSDVAHCLSDVAARVWRACDGARDLAGLAALTGADEELVADAIDGLREKQLLMDEEAARPSVVSRRHAIRRMAGIGAGAMSVPLIVSAVAASPAAAVTGAACGGNNVPVLFANAQCNLTPVGQEGPADGMRTETCNCPTKIGIGGILVCSAGGLCV